MFPRSLEVFADHHHFYVWDASVEPIVGSGKHGRCFPEPTPPMFPGPEASMGAGERTASAAPIRR
jgi:hypothetical protein